MSRTEITHADFPGLSYRPESGTFMRNGEVAGTVNVRGYRQISHKCKLYYAHRLAIWFVKGSEPAKWVDHANGQRDDNRYANLREATASENNCNRKPKPDRLKGITVDRRNGKFMAQIGINRRTVALGYFDTPEEAHAAYVAAAHRLHGAFARVE
jgi:hypothetical protein